MPTTVRAALVQTTWTGDKESMIKAHEEYAREAAAQGAKVVCFQELFYGPYFCQVQDAKFYEYAESVPGPTVERFAALAARARHGDGPAGVRAGAAGRPLQHRRGDRRGRDVPRQVPQDPHPARQRLLGEVLLPAGQPGLSGLRHRGRPGRRLHLLRPALPGGLAGARPQRRRDRLQPLGHQPRPVQLPLEAGADRRRGRQRVLRRARSTGSASRTSATTTSTARPTSPIPRASPSTGTAPTPRPS